MNDRDVDMHLKDSLQGDSPREVFRQQMLRDSTAEFVRVRRRHVVWCRAGLAVSAMIIIGTAFLGGRLSVSHKLSVNEENTPLAKSVSNDITVPKELLAWLDAARLFGQLGMEDRMARAVAHAGKLLPVDIGIADDRVGPVFAATKSVENHNECTESMDLLGPHPSAESVDQVLALSLGD